MSEPVTAALGPCFVHGGIFAFDPDRVPTVLVDPETGRPLDVDAAGRLCEPPPGALGRSQKRPYCPGCAKAMNAVRAAWGQSRIFDETDTAAALGA
jgi:hypothetical protein